MPTRYTEDDAIACAQRLGKLMGIPTHPRAADCLDEKKGEPCLVVRCESTYGGCNMVQVIPPGTGESMPFGEFRLPPREFCEATRLAEGVLGLFADRLSDITSFMKREIRT